MEYIIQEHEGTFDWNNLPPGIYSIACSNHLKRKIGRYFREKNEVWTNLDPILIDSAKSLAWRIICFIKEENDPDILFWLLEEMKSLVNKEFINLEVS